MARIAMYQMSHSGSIEENIYKSISVIREAAYNGADIILFPEVQLTEFFPQYPGLNVSGYAVDIESDVVSRFRKACEDNHIMAVPNIYLKEADKIYDASILIGRDGEIIGIQKMVHIAEAEQFYEQDYYTPSDEGFQVFDTDIGRIGIVICFDRHYPEGIRTETLRGADLILIPTANVKSEPLTMFEWEVKVQAFQNSVMVAMCNRVGTEGNMNFAGESIVVDANGDTLIKADDQEQLIVCDVDIEESKRVRQSKPYTDLRRKEFYE